MKRERGNGGGGRYKLRNIRIKKKDLNFIADFVARRLAAKLMVLIFVHFGR